MEQAASERFKALMLRWIREDPDGILKWRSIDTDGVSEVLTVTTYGTDWEGGTEEGFYSDADTTIKYKIGQDVKTVELKGEALESMWRFVMREV